MSQVDQGSALDVFFEYTEALGVTWIVMVAMVVIADARDESIRKFALYIASR